MNRHDSGRRLWPVAKATCHREWGMWVFGELQYSKDLQELLDIVDI